MGRIVHLPSRKRPSISALLGLLILSQGFCLAFSTVPATPPLATVSTSFMSAAASEGDADSTDASVGRLEALKQQEAELARALAGIRREKLAVLRSRPLTIGVVGFGRFGQFIARTFRKYGQVVVTSRSDYTDLANGMGVTYVPLDDPDAFLEDHHPDVIVFGVSILSFKSTIQKFAPHLEAYLSRHPNTRGPLIVDVLSVKEHARNVLLEYLPESCDILCTHPMFGPDSGANGWRNLNFVYEKTRIDQVLLDTPSAAAAMASPANVTHNESFQNDEGQIHSSINEDSLAHIEGVDRMERFLSIWEEEGCRMVPMNCRDHDAYAANSQFVTHLMGRILGSQGLRATPIDTSGFQSVLKLIGSTTADSFDLFYGLYKYNQNSRLTITQLQQALGDVVHDLDEMERQELATEAAATVEASGAVHKA